MVGSSRRRVVQACAAVILVVAALRVFVAPPTTTADEVRLDAVVVLGGGIGTERLDRALEVLAVQVAAGSRPTLVVSVPYEPPLLRCGDEVPVRGTDVSSPVVCVLPEPFTTTGEAAAVARFVAAEGWEHVGIVTSTFHLARARTLFDRCLTVPVAGFAASVPLTEVRLWWNVLQEIPSLAAALTFDRAAC